MAQQHDEFTVSQHRLDPQHLVLVESGERHLDGSLPLLVSHRIYLARLIARKLSGQSWSQFEKKQYKPAAAGFARLLKEFPQQELAGESAFKLGESLQLDGKILVSGQAQQNFDGYGLARINP